MIPIILANINAYIVELLTICVEMCTSVTAKCAFLLLQREHDYIF